MFVGLKIRIAIANFFNNNFTDVDEKFEYFGGIYNILDLSGGVLRVVEVIVKDFKDELNFFDFFKHDRRSQFYLFYTVIHCF